jgi:hypothetical protein
LEVILWNNRNNFVFTRLQLPNIAVISNIISSKKINKYMKNQILNDYIDNNKSIQKAAKLNNITSYKARKILVSAGVDFGKKRRGPEPKFDLEQFKLLLQTKSIVEIAKELKVKYNSAWCYAKRHKLITDNH